jgi:hypothetical protein
MKITPCTFGYHDYQVFNDVDKILTELSDWLSYQEFTRYNEKNKIPYWTNNKIKIFEWGMIGDDTISNCIDRGDTFTKVCTSCKKIKLTYNMESIKMKLYNIIGKKLLLYEKREEAKRILNGE